MLQHPTYADDPLGRFLELYVLRAIDALNAEDDDTIQRYSPTLRAVFHCDGEWHDVVEQVMQFPKDAPESIQYVWQLSKDMARRQGRRLNPAEFAQRFINMNFQ